MASISPSPIDPARAAETNAARILAISAIFHFTALTVVSLRSYTRLILVRSFGVHDVVMILALICAFAGGMIPLFLQGRYGLGHHIDTIAPDDLIALNKLSFVQSVVAHMAGIGLLKIAIALELMKLKSHAWLWYTVILWFLIIFVCAYTFMAWITIFLFCQPLARYFDPTVEGHCYSINLFVKFGLINTGLNIFTDVAFATLPVPVIWTLKMSFRTRAYLIGVLSLGYIAVVMGILKAYYQIRFTDDLDKTFNYNVQFWGLLQLNLGIIAICAPSLKPLVGNILKLKGLTPNRYQSSGGYHHSNRTGGRQNRTLTIGTSAAKGYTRQDSTTEDKGDFELLERRLHGKGDMYTATVARRDAAGSNSAPYQTSGDGSSAYRNGSEDSILAGLGSVNGKGIVRTTEVSVMY